jgi:REP element-mobilizing transposase RayT
MATRAQKEASAGRRDSNRGREHARPHRRVRARRIVPGTTYKITKRCLERRFFLVADRDEVHDLIGFTLALCANRFGIQVHAACFMSNHYHLDVTDPRGALPAFKAMLNSFLARAFNALRGRFDRFWSGDRACDVELVEAQDVLDGMAYTLANPVEAGLVKRARRWPGFTTAGMKFGEKREFRRPKVFYDAANEDLPDRIELEVVRPLRGEASAQEADEELARLVQRRERAAAKKLLEEHRRFHGENRVRRQRWSGQPRTFDARFTRTPRVSSRSRWDRIAALQRNREWEAKYAEAYEAWLRGADVEFPYGTWALSRIARVRVAAAPPD